MFFTGKLVKATKQSQRVLSASCLCFVKYTTTPPPSQVVNSDNGLILAFNNSPTKMTGDNTCLQTELSVPHALETTTLHIVLF